MTENTADKEAENRFLTFVDQIAPNAQVARQALKKKLLSLPTYQPSPDTEQMIKRFRAEVSIYRDQNVPLLSE